MFEQLKKTVVGVAKAVWCHRAAYAGLALAYGAGCAGWIDKDTVSQIATAMYVAITIQRH